MSRPSTKNREKEDQVKRGRLAGVRVLLADRDYRTAKLVHRILFSFGFRKIDTVSSGEEAIERLKRFSFELIITEWNMSPIDGLTLVKAIRSAKDDKRIRRDIPILMLTAQSEKDNVESARDAGINEFVVKPFSARTMSDRIIQIIDNPRSFIEAPGYAGPCRRRREGPPPGMDERRGARSTEDDAKFAALRAAKAATITPPNNILQDKFSPAAAIFTDEIIEEAQGELMKAESEFVSWARDDIKLIEAAYAQLAADPASIPARQAMLQATYSIKSQAGIFGYALGTEIASMLVRYLGACLTLQAEQMTVIRKHIDTIVVIFSQQIKDSKQDVAAELVKSLKALTEKLG